MPVDAKTASWYERHGHRPPESTSHGVTPDDLSDKLKPLKPHSWKLQGNKLTGQTDMGPLVQFIPTNYILDGTDAKGLPILRKID